MSASISGLHLYPLKSCAALSVQSVDVEPRGCRDDRRWMVCDPDGRFLTGRQLPILSLLRATPGADGSLRLEAPQMTPYTVAAPTGESRMRVTVWKDTVDAARANEDADAWLAAFLQRPARLVAMDAQARRPVDAAYGTAGDEVSFADGYPLLLVSQAALDGLNRRLARPVSMLRFRPNLVADGCGAHAEDDWQRIRVGEVEFDVVKSCKRCVFTTVDPATGERDADGEPLRTLLDYRRADSGGALFGRNLIPRGRGRLRIGDPIEVLA